MPLYLEQDFSVYISRRKQLLQKIKSTHSDTKKGAIVLFGAFENERYRFMQDSTFYYFTGIEEPGAAVVIDLTGQTTLFVPEYKGGRSQWIASRIDLNQTSASRLGFDRIDVLGKPCAGYSCYAFFENDEYEYLVKALADIVREDGDVFCCNPLTRLHYAQQKTILRDIDRFMRKMHSGIPQDFLSACVDISGDIAQMRRHKDSHELALVHEAIDITFTAQEAAAQLIKPGAIEYEVQAGIEFVFTQSGAGVAFPSIVASGPNSTVLHYTLNNRTIEKGDVVIVDIGAQFNYYCADITRTYPSSGSFTDRQKEIYNLVLDTQAYIADIAKPGMWLSNEQHQDQSLNHLAKKYLDEHGEYASNMPHGIGHYLGLDVHDVGSLAEPLQEGDLFTIEPGVYLSKEQIGVRIEDNYLMAKSGVICLSEEIPKSVVAIEQMSGNNK